MAVILTCIFAACNKTGSQDPNNNDNNTTTQDPNNNDNNSTTPYIRFIVNDTEYSKVQTKGNEIIVMPTNPQKDGYTFVGWFWDKDTWQRPFTANSMLNEPMNSDMKVYAYFEKQHQHTYAKEWEYNNTYHWHASTCGHDIVSDKATHDFDANHICTICGYQDTKLHGVEIKTNTLSVDGTNISGKVSNATTIFSFIDEISVADSATYTVSTDINGSHTIKTKTVNLSIGDNTYYIFVENGKDIRLYTVSIRRRPIYTVTFDSNGGTEVEQQQVEEDSFATEPNTTRIGYNFDKWNYDFTKPILKDGTITADWSAVRYSITYVLNGGENNSDNPLTYTVEDEIILLAPTKAGYMGSWSNDGKIEIGSMGNKTFTAIYTANKYNVQLTTDGKCYVANGGAYDCDTSVTVSLTTLYWGYDFLGWYDGDTFCSKEQLYTFTMPANDICLTAKTVVKNEMQIFDFSSTENTCVIEKVKDEQIQSLTIPDYVTSIGNFAFYGCSSLTEVNWNATECTRTGSYDYPIFKGCSNLTTVNIGNNVTIIPAYAFKECIGLKKIIIPDSVTCIGDYAFNGCAYLSSVYITNIATWCAISFENIYSNPLYYAHVLYLNDELVIDLIIPDSVTSISDYAFAYCDDLTSVTIGSSVTIIGSSAFSGCSGLTAVNWNATACTQAGSSLSPVFSGCSNLTTVNVGNNVTIIPAYTFSDCSGLTTVNWNATACTSAGSFDSGNYSSTFDGCKNLSALNIGENVTTIPAYAFYGCKGLINITIPDSVTSIGGYAFSGCSGLTTVNWSATACTSAGSFDYSIFDGCTSLSTLNISDNVTTIPDYAFSNFSGLTTVNWNATACTRAGSSLSPVFSGCSNLTTVNVGNNVTIIPSCAFYGCSSLTSIMIPDSVSSIGSSAFSGCSSLTSITIPDSVTRIDDDVFSGCGLKNFIIPDSITDIGDSAFSGCTSLTSISIPDSVTNIGAFAFRFCYNLTNIEIPNTVNSIDSFAFERCGITSITIPESVCGVERSIFKGCSNLTTVNWDAIACRGAGSLQYLTFSDCSNLTTVNIGNNVTIIPSYIFAGCTGLTNITIPDSVTSIGNCAFYGCKGLKNITIPDNVTSIGGYAFSGCSGLTTINWNATACTNAGSSDYPILGNCSKLTTINIGYNVTTIPAYAFYDCAGLTSIAIPNGVTNIGVCALGGCSSLKSITIPFVGKSNNATAYEAVLGYIFGYKTEILTGDYNWATTANESCSTSFYYSSASDVSGATWQYSCYNSYGEYYGLPYCWNDKKHSLTYTKNNGYRLQSYYFYIPASLKNVVVTGEKVSDYAFFNCKGLTSITISNSVSNIGVGAFKNCNSLTNITIPDSVTSIGDYAFSGCTGLTNIAIPNNVTSICDYAFSVCSGLTDITIPGSVTSIGNYAFSGCSGLTSVTIPDSVTSIGNYAFYNCSGLKTVFYAGTEEQGKAISIGSDNSRLTSATRYYYSETEPALNSDGTGYDGNYWHYDTDGTTIVIWVYKTEEE